MLSKIFRLFQQKLRNIFYICRLFACFEWPAFDFTSKRDIAASWKARFVLFHMTVVLQNFFATIPILTLLFLMLRAPENVHRTTWPILIFLRGVLVTICSAATLPDVPLSRPPSAYNAPHGTLFVVHFHFADVVPLRPQSLDLLHAIIFFVSLISLHLSITHSRHAAFFIAK